MPRFEWAAHGNRVTGRMYGMTALTAAMNDNHVFAGGYLKSTLDPEAAGFVESPTDYAVTGPYTTSDWNGTNAQTITVDLKSHPTLKMLAARGARARRASWRSTRRLRAHRTGYVLRSRTSPTMLGRSLLDVGPISLTEDGLDADQAEDRYAAWVAPYHLPEEGGAEPGLSKATPPRHRSAPCNVVPMVGGASQHDA